MVRTLIAGMVFGGAALLALPPGAAQSRSDLAGAADPETIRVVGCAIREDDYARATGGEPPSRDASAPVQIVIARDSGPAYSLTGTRESELSAYLGRRVEVTGVIESLRVAGPVRGTSAPAGAAGRVAAGRPPTGAEGVTRDGSPSHEPGDAVPGSDPTPEVQAGQGAAGRAAGTTRPRLNVAAFRVLEGECERVNERTDTRANRVPQQGAAAANAAPAPARAAVPAPPRAVTATGCFVRQTPAGGALTAAPGDAPNVFVLTQANIEPARGTSTGSAVPGSAPSGSGSGTVPVGTANSRAGTVAERSIEIVVRADADAAELAKHVGQRVAVTGTIEDPAPRAEPDGARSSASTAGTAGRVETPASVAHPSAPVQRIRLDSLRATGGSCN